MAKKIVAAGNLCLDITPVFSQEHPMDASQIFLPGKLISVGPAQMNAGGSITNTGLACHYFGAAVTLMGKVGDDYFGKMILDIIDKYDVSSQIKVSGKCDTSYTVIMAPPGVDRIFFHCPGANDTFGYDDIDFKIVGDADLFHFGYPTVMKRLYQNPQELIDIYKKAKGLHTKTSLDLAAVTENTEAASVDWCAVFREILPYVDYFVPSAEELCFLIDRPRYREWAARADGRDITEVIDWKADIRPLADKLMSWGAKCVLIKCGTPGMYLRTGRIEEAQSPIEKSWDSVELFERSYKAERFCSATGAGDVSIAAFLTAAPNGCTPERCLQLAAGAGACCVTAYDALSGLISFDALKKKIDEGWKKN